MALKPVEAGHGVPPVSKLSRIGHKKRAIRVDRPRVESDVRARLMKSAPRREGIAIGLPTQVADHERAHRRRRGTDRRRGDGAGGEGVEGACHIGNSYEAFATVTQPRMDCK